MQSYELEKTDFRQKWIIINNTVKGLILSGLLCVPVFIHGQGQNDQSVCKAVFLSGMSFQLMVLHLMFEFNLLLLKYIKYLVQNILGMKEILSVC